MKRRTIAIVVGIILGGLFIALGESLSTYLFPFEMPIPTDRSLIADFYENDVSFGFKFVIVLNWIIAAFVAAISSTFISGRDSSIPMLASVGVLNFLTLIQVLITQYPKWMLISTLFIFIPIGYIAYFLIRKKNTDEGIG
jgi:hypothetical protein